MKEKAERPMEACNMFWASWQGIHSGHYWGMTLSVRKRIDEGYPA